MSTHQRDYWQRRLHGPWATRITDTSEGVYDADGAHVSAVVFSSTGGALSARARAEMGAALPQVLDAMRNMLLSDAAADMRELRAAYVQATGCAPGQEPPVREGA